MLEQHGIDYILLEAYPTIAPQAGASIGLAPNGLRILDQLGCYERVRDMAGNYYKTLDMRDLEGRLLFSNRGPGFAERFEHIVMPGKRVVQVEMSDEGPALIHTQDGSVYDGDIVVGADGVHSATRAEMWRLAAQLRPGTFPADEESRLKAEAKCIFGISKIPADFPSTTQLLVSSKGLSHMAIPGPGDRLYWFMFVSMATTPSRDIPRWSKQDEEELAEQHFKDKITDKVTFGDIYNNRRATALVPLEEHVFTRWHFKRIITIGDSAHKVGHLRAICQNLSQVAYTVLSQVHPLTALGGNGAMESAALLCNALARRLKQNSGVLSDADIEEAFLEVQVRQLRRAQDIVKEGKRTQRWVNQLYPLSGLVMRYLLPLAWENLFIGGDLKVSLEGPRIEKLVIPERPHTIPFRDEMPEPAPRATWTVWSAGILVLGVVGYYMAQSMG
ncbi:hypothetical protein DL768_003164 [Monosporascus sp. mg162]|nr:hypothetical protein DL768_003164 [Monosporascus sp. mg162]